MANQIRAAGAQVTDGEHAAAVYRSLRGTEPDWASIEWNWFKIGWDAYWIAERATPQIDAPSAQPAAANDHRA